MYNKIHKMDFTERFDLTRIEYLNQMPIGTFSEYLQDETDDVKPKSEVAKQYKKLRAFCRQHIKAKGEINRLYAYTLTTPNETGGRMFCGSSIQGFFKRFRGFLGAGGTTDLDMANAHPMILRYICVENNIPCFCLNNYIEKRDDILLEFPNRATGKKAFLKAINNDKYDRTIDHEFFKLFDNEMKQIQRKIIKLDCFKSIADIPSTKNYNMTGTVLNRILCHYENKILREAISFLQKKEIEICCPMFDGVLVYGDHYDDNELLDELTEVVEETFPGLEMKWTYKTHDDSITMPADFEPSSKKIEKMKTYEQVKAEFEATHLKIINRSLFLKREDDGSHVVFSQDRLKTSYGHLKFDTFEEDACEVVKNPFIV